MSTQFEKQRKKKEMKKEKAFTEGKQCFFLSKVRATDTKREEKRKRKVNFEYRKLRKKKTKVKREGEAR